MKTYITYSLTNSGSFFSEGTSWQDLRHNAMNYYGVQNLFYKEVHVDDFFIENMLVFVGSIKLSLHPNSAPVFVIKVKESGALNHAYQMNMPFTDKSLVQGVA